MKVRVFFAWFDLWVGAYVSRESRTLYICPLPMLGISFSWGPPKDTCRKCREWRVNRWDNVECRISDGAYFKSINSIQRILRLGWPPVRKWCPKRKRKGKA